MNSVDNSALAQAISYEQAQQNALLEVTIKLSNSRLTTEAETKLKKEQVVIESGLASAKELVSRLLSQPALPPVPQQWRAPGDLPKYSTGTAIKEFIQRYETVLASEGIPIAKWLDFLPRCFQGTDFALLSSQIMPKIGDWDACKLLLTTHFGPRQPFRHAFGELFFIRQGENEHIRSFIGRFRALADDVGNADNDFLVFAFLKGLPGHTRSKLESSSLWIEGLPGFPPLESVITAAFDFASIPIPAHAPRREVHHTGSRGNPKPRVSRYNTQGSRISGPPTPSVNFIDASIKHSSVYSGPPLPGTQSHAGCMSHEVRPPPMLDDAKPVAAEADRNKPSLAPITDEGNAKSYADCMSHEVRTPPMPDDATPFAAEADRNKPSLAPITDKGNAKSHDDCMSHEVCIPPPPEDITLVSSNAGNNKPFLAPITINGIRIEALIDTGASVSIISEDLANFLEFESVPFEGQLRFAEKDSHSPRKKLKTPIILECGSKRVKLQPDIVSLSEDISFILGRDILAELGIGLINLPIYYPDEVIAEESDDCLLCDSKQLAKIVTEDEDSSIPVALASYLEENEALDPMVPCSLPKEGYRLHAKPNSPRIYRRQYDMCVTKQEALDAQVVKWINAGVVVRCKEGSPYNSPIMTVPKRDELGTKTGTRVCIDPRPINAILEDDAFLVPLVTEVFQKTAGHQYFSTIDLKEAYTQIPLHPDSQEFTAFSWKGLQYKFTRCIFGIKTMSAMFQRVITNVLEDCLEFAACYVDDIVIMSKTKEDHIEHVGKVLQALTKAHLRVNKSKSKFGMKKVKLLGFLVSEEGIIPDQGRLADIFNVPTPTSVKEIQRFLGMTNYLRQHVPMYADIAHPLEAVRMSKSFQWSPSLDEAFKRLKTAIIHAKLLSVPRPDLPLLLATDASNEGIAAMLYQIDGDKQLFLSFESRALKEAERNYHANKKELLAIVFGLLKNQHIVQGRHFTLLTDHHSLIYLKSQAQATAIMANWFDIIESFSFSVAHIKGIDNVVPDALSRAPCPDHTLLLVDQAQSQLETPPIDLQAVHQLGHFQADLMVDYLKDRGHSWSNMYTDCAEVAKSCLTCQRCNNKASGYNPLQPIDAPRPFDHVQIDLVTDLPPSPEGYLHVLVLTDVASKFTILRPLKDKSARSTAKTLLQIISDFGPPRIIQSDQGKEFDNSVIRQVCSAFSTEQRLSSAYSPRTNGLVERTNRTWVSILRKLAMFSQSLWPDFLPITQFFLNIRITQSISVSPFEALFCRKSNELVNFASQQPIDALSEEEIVRRICHAQSNFWPSLLQRSVASHERMSENFNEANRLTTFSKGDIVFVRNPRALKLDPEFAGPFRITRKTAANSYDLVDAANVPFHRRVTTSQLKLAHSQADTPDDEDRFEFEHIIDHRGDISNREYLVKWKDYPISDASWVRQEDFTDPSSLTRYWASRGG